MAKFRVNLVAQLSGLYSFDVEADDASQAREKAIRSVPSDPDKWAVRSSVAVQDVQVLSIGILAQD